MLTQSLGEGLYLLRLLTDATVHGAGQTNNDLLNLMLINKPGNRLYIQPLLLTVDDSEWAG